MGVAAAGRASTGALLLFPGAGAGRDHPALVAIERAAAPGWRTLRADFDYRREGRRAPDRPPRLMAAVRAQLALIEAPRIVVGGRSMGGRICSMVAAGADGEPPDPRVAGVVAVSYPLHPPGRPERLRVEHLSALRVPCLFACGTRDPFGSPAELERWSATIAGPVAHHWVEGRGHDLRGAEADVAAVVAGWLGGLA